MRSWMFSLRWDYFLSRTVSRASPADAGSASTENRAPRLTRARHAVPLRRRRGGDIVASWGASLRSRTAGSQDESRCDAIHKPRPKQNESQAVAHDHAENVAGLRAERHAQTDFAGALRDQIGEHAENSGGGEQQGDGGKSAEQQ